MCAQKKAGKWQCDQELAKYIMGNVDIPVVLGEKNCSDISNVILELFQGLTGYVADTY